MAARRRLPPMRLPKNRTSIEQAVADGLLRRSHAGLAARECAAGQQIGHRDIEANLPMQRDTIFRIASMSKPVTVAAAMALVDEGKLALSDPVSTWLPSWSRCGC